MTENGAPEQKATVQTVQFRKNGKSVDLTVASEPLSPGDVALRVPEHLIVTLDSVFQDDGALAELLTTNKLSELACLTLYLAYEKKRGPDSKWYPLIKELDRQGGRGSQGAKSPLLWEPGQASALLSGSPVLAQLSTRLAGIAREYEELDTVWYLAGALFKNYPFEMPTEQFSLDLFTQAFAAVQSSVVHLQGVPLGKRFAMVPLGPPLLTYSSTCRAMLQYNREAKEVQLAVDRAYNPGEPLLAWCGPQPNSRLLINYGVVDDNNPYDKLPLGVTLPSDDPLFRQKRQKLSEVGLSTQQTFQLSRSEPLPQNLLPYLRCAFASTEEELAKVVIPGSSGDSNGDADASNAAAAAAGPVSDVNEKTALAQLAGELTRRLAGYRTTIEEDNAVVADTALGARERVAARLLRIEKAILQSALAEVQRMPGADEAGIAAGNGGDAYGVLFSSS
jgi:hypothetical protein